MMMPVCAKQRVAMVDISKCDAVSIVPIEGNAGEILAKCVCIIDPTSTVGWL